MAITLEFGMQRVPGEVGPGGAITQPARLYIFMDFYICIHTYIHTYIHIYICMCICNNNACMCACTNSALNLL